jgi:hypothetical protein
MIRLLCLTSLLSSLLGFLVGATVAVSLQLWRDRVHGRRVW